MHGLTGGWDSTWTAEDSIEPWPKSLLSQDINDVRILSWGYDADIVKLWNPASNNRVANHAQNLIGDLARKRDESVLLSRMKPDKFPDKLTSSEGIPKNYFCSTQSRRPCDRRGIVPILEQPR